MAYLLGWNGRRPGEGDAAAERIFYDELPLRVRTIDFSKPSGDFSIQLAPRHYQLQEGPSGLDTCAGALRIERPRYLTSPCSMRPGPTGSCSTAISLFSFAPGKRLMAADYQLKRSLKIDYWNYHGLGDRKRALLNPQGAASGLTTPNERGSCDSCQSRRGLGRHRCGHFWDRAIASTAPSKTARKQRSRSVQSIQSP